MKQMAKVAPTNGGLEFPGQDDQGTDRPLMFGTPTQNLTNQTKRKQSDVSSDDECPQSGSLSLDLENVDLRVRIGSG